MAKQIQITKAWGEGSIPENRGRYVLCNADYSNPRFIDAVVVGTGLKVFNMDGSDVPQDDNARHFGPLPGIGRSISAQARRASEPVEA